MSNTERKGANNKENKPIIATWQEVLNQLNNLYERESRTGELVEIESGKENVLLMKTRSPENGAIRALMFVRYSSPNIINFSEGGNIIYYPTNAELFAGEYNLDKGTIEINERILPKLRFNLYGIERPFKKGAEAVDIKYSGNLVQGITRIEKTTTIKGVVREHEKEIFDIKDEKADTRIVLIIEMVTVTKRLQDFIDKWG